MSADGRMGRGAFRCGCGVRIQVSEEAGNLTACSATGCRTASVTGSSIRLCASHKDEVTMMLATDVARVDLKNLGTLYRDHAIRWSPPAIPAYVIAAENSVVCEVPHSGKHDPVVYFIRNGDRVKIGYTTHLAARLSALSLRRDAVVLILDGDRRLESALHSRFAGKRIPRTEWFRWDQEIETFVTRKQSLP
jgi:hypothetical protein